MNKVDVRTSMTGVWWENGVQPCWHDENVKARVLYTSCQHSDFKMVSEWCCSQTNAFLWRTSSSISLASFSEHTVMHRAVQPQLLISDSLSNWSWRVAGARRKKGREDGYVNCKWTHQYHVLCSKWCVQCHLGVKRKESESYHFLKVASPMMTTWKISILWGTWIRYRPS
jgi:ssDNA-binding Zn-finger/Zn-ribbon topoisomerase 1